MKSLARVCALVWLVPLLAPVVVAGADFEDRGTPAESDGVITPANLGPREVWPLNIQRVKIVCHGQAVFVTNGTTEYPLNGLAKALTRKDPKGRRPLEDIWLVDDKTLAGVRASGIKVKMVRVDITPVLNRGVDWCRSRL